jgi:hypothetical protein
VTAGAAAEVAKSESTFFVNTMNNIETSMIILF